MHHCVPKYKHRIKLFRKTKKKLWYQASGYSDILMLKYIQFQYFNTGPKKEDEDAGLKMWPPPAPPTNMPPAPPPVLEGREGPSHTTNAEGLQRQPSEPGEGGQTGVKRSESVEPGGSEQVFHRQGMLRTFL